MKKRQARNKTGHPDTVSADTRYRLLVTVMIVGFFSVLLHTALHTQNRFVWFFHSLIPVLALLLLLLLHKRFRPSLSTCLTLFFWSMLMLWGAQWEFQNIPAFQIQLADGTMRSTVDWITHFVDGVLYALLTWDILCQRSKAPEGNSLPFSRKERRVWPIFSGIHSAGYFIPSTSKTSFRMIVWSSLISSLVLALAWEGIEVLAALSTGDRFLMRGGVLFDTAMDITMTIAGTALMLPLLAKRWRARTTR